MELNGSTALVTGASGGLGRAIARALHQRGAGLVLTARREQALEELRAELGERVRVLPADLADASSAAELAAGAGDVDVLVANAGLPGSGRYDDFTSEEIDRALDVNLRAPMHLARELAPRMAARGRGHIVFVSSLSGRVPSVGASLYSATKFGLRGYAGGLREDLRDAGVGVTVVFPGFIRGAGMFADSGVKLRPGVGTRTPEQVAAAVVRGIEKDKPELSVAPLAVRLGTRLSELAPVPAARLQRRLGAEKISEEMAEAQRDKR